MSTTPQNHNTRHSQGAMAVEHDQTALQPAIVIDDATGSRVALLEESFAKIQPVADDFADSFYKNLFEDYPSAKLLFAQVNMSAQAKKLIASLEFVIEHLRKPQALNETLKGLGTRHVKYGVLPEHYPLVGNALLKTFEQYLGGDWTVEVKEAWVAAYELISEVMLDGADSSPEQEKVKLLKRSPKRANQIQPNFKILIGLTFLTALLLLPFVFSSSYLEVLRNNSVELHHFLRGEIYKQITGYIALSFCLFEIILTARKRGRGWIVSIKVPGSMNFWRSMHIFLGVALLGMVAVHTFGANGLNFNAVFLWVFFGVTLTAMVGVVAETGILESPRRDFGRLPGAARALTKGPLIRGLRAIWLTSHIFLVCLFAVMLVMHIILVYYYQ